MPNGVCNGGAPLSFDGRCEIPLCINDNDCDQGGTVKATCNILTGLCVSYCTEDADCGYGACAIPEGEIKGACGCSDNQVCIDWATAESMANPDSFVCVGL
jgi:hypothetical protein